MYGNGYKTCSGFFAVNTENRCSKSPKGRHNCPLTCGLCPTQFPSLSPSVSNSPSAQLSDIPSASPSVISEGPSASPSMAPTPLRSRVAVSATIPIQMGPVDGNIMAERNIKLLQDTLRAWLIDVNFTPTLRNIRAKINNQNVTTVPGRRKELRRQLLNAGDYILLFDLEVKGNFQPQGAADQPGSVINAVDYDLENKLKPLFNNSTNSQSIITALTSDTSSAVDYFSEISTISSPKNDPNPIDSTRENETNNGESPPFWTNNTILILAGTISGCAILGAIALLFIYGKGRR